MNKKENRKPYKKPEIIHELELETRAGSVPDLPANDPFEISDE
jgi:hypothetical protein